jgi:hypothetical protein
MSIENEILTEVEALKVRFPETKSLYREVCALLFFRHGITPTASKLYQYVRKGSMSVPAEALIRFWDELRSKARVEIDHPDLPPSLASAAAEAIGEIWRQASEAARTELAALRVEAQQKVDAAEANVRAANAEVESLKEAAHSASAAAAAADATAAQVRDELEAERRAHVASVARHQESQRAAQELKDQLKRQGEAFSADLAKAREAVEQANLRADAGERRAMLEIDQERQARGRAEKQTEGLRTQLAAAEARERASAMENADATSALQSKLRAAEAASLSATDTVSRLSSELQATVEGLRDAQRDSLQWETEARTVRSILERLAPPEKGNSPVLPERPARPSRRKT